jgi:hypothetical protein
MPQLGNCPWELSDLAQHWLKGGAKDNSMFDLPTPQCI